jgi:NAD(P)-dependent dehydrogenase (short-subunit alcohol dehydrogenase family)
MATVLITGANRGIGLELAKRYVENGERVIGCCRSAAAATELQSLSQHGDLEVLEVQVSDAESVRALAAKLAGETIDILINNAGTSGPDRDEQTVYRMDFEGWANTFAVNTLAPVRIMQALLDNLKASDSGKLVTITSQLGALSLDLPFAYAYSTSKAAINKFMKLAAIDLRNEGISVALIHPGWVKTDMGGSKADLSPEESARGIVNVIANLSLDNTGGFWKWNGEVHGW